MEGIKAKDELIRGLRSAAFDYDVPQPERPILAPMEVEKEYYEQDVLDTLSRENVHEYLYNEAIAATIGKFIHQGGKLASLRDQLSTIPPTKWHSIVKDETTPVKVVKHHTQEDLSKLHEQLAGLHRDAEKRVNYYKALILNNLADMNASEAKRVSLINSKIQKENNDMNQSYLNKYADWSMNLKIARDKFEAERENQIKEASQLRILVPADLQPLVDEFMSKLDVDK
jgi:hypothetical protein